MDLYFIYYYPEYQKTLYIESIVSKFCLFTKFPSRAKLFTKDEATELVRQLNEVNRKKTFYSVKDEYSSKFDGKQLIHL